MPGTGSLRLVEVAVPLPLPGALTYSVPPALDSIVRVGVRVRVTVGRRRLTGLVWAEGGTLPPGVEARPVDAALDLDPIFPPDLLELARFTADYYLASPGDVTAAMLPGDLPPWGDRTIALTSAGAMAPCRAPVEARLRELLLEKGRLRLSDLMAELPAAELSPVVRRWLADGWIHDLGGSGRGARYAAAVGLAAGDPDELRARAGRSPAGRAVVDFLAALGRPATVEEVSTATEASSAVVRRLVSLGLLLRFQQPQRLALDRHLMRIAGAEEPAHQLLPAQEEALAAVIAASAGKRFERILLHGVTGSGKTEVYLRAAAALLLRDRSSILLVPEIALVPALARAARDRFGDQMAVLHSGMAGAERAQEWERIRSGEARIVVGPRSALFAPVHNLGMIVVDEEQDPAYKQDSAPRYHGRDLALVRCQRAGAVALLASATPSLEARAAVERGTMVRLGLPERVGGAQLPEGIMVDLRSEPRVGRPAELLFSRRLLEELDSALRAGGQAILLRNRRGYAPMLLCRACGEEFRCDACGLARTLHRRARALICHWCASTQPEPDRCPGCGGETLEPIGAGTERIEEQVREFFPEVSVGVLDRDATQRIGGAAAILERFRSGETRVLVGTQMLSKGHHFPNVSLTAVLAADAYLGFPDFRAVERTYSMLTQLAGRAGRGERPGRVVFQTYHPEHYALRAVLLHDDAAFAAHELRFRKLFDYPPFCRMALVLVRGGDREQAWSRLRDFAARLGSVATAAGLRLSGPAPAPLERLRGEWRFHLLVRARSAGALRGALLHALGSRNEPGLVVDIDPYQML